MLCGLALHYGETGQRWWYAALNTQRMTSPAFVIPLGILLCYRFRGKWDRLRVAAMYAMILVLILQILGSWIWSFWFQILIEVFTCGKLLLLVVAVWCLAFRRGDKAQQG